MLFATASTGYKTGGFNSEGAKDDLNALGLRTYDSETTDSYEIGMKSIFLDGGVVPNAAAYYMYWEDLPDHLRVFNTSFDVPWVVSPGAGSAAIRELSQHGLLGVRATAFPAKIPMVQGTPESHLRSEKYARYLSEYPKKMVNNTYA
jgi:hypothetical protein